MVPHQQGVVKVSQGIRLLVKELVKENKVKVNEDPGSTVNSGILVDLIKVFSFIS